MMEEFDAIVIGAGHQGLIAATVLAESGLAAAVVEADQKVFRSAVDAQHAAALDALRKFSRQRHPKVAPALDEANDAPTDQSRNETAADCFDLGQLGHASVAAPQAARWPNKAAAIGAR